MKGILVIGHCKLDQIHWGATYNKNLLKCSAIIWGSVFSLKISCTSTISGSEKSDFTLKLLITFMLGLDSLLDSDKSSLWYFFLQLP